MTFWLSMYELTASLAQAAPSVQAQGGDSKYLIVGLIAIALAIGIFMVELFVPSGGVLGVIAVSALVVGIVSFSFYSPTLGVLTALAALLASPFLFGMAVKVWPTTPIARLLTHRESQATLTAAGSGRSATGPDSFEDARTRDEGGLKVGDAGQAVTDLRPVGTCVLNGKRTDCLADGGTINAGARVTVVAVDGMQVKVRAVR